MSRNKLLILLSISFILVGSVCDWLLLEQSKRSEEINIQLTHEIPERNSDPTLFDRRGATILPEPSFEPLHAQMHGNDTKILSIDAELQNSVYQAIEEVATSAGYAGGAGIIMDVRTGELLTLASYSNESSPLNLATEGLFIPGSILKPFVALAALNENSIDPNTKILSTGFLQLVDDAGTTLTFKDWKSHGYVDMREAIGVSSNVYFYIVGGGYEHQEGLGIDRIVRYLHMFGIGDKTGLESLPEAQGQLPDPTWKRAVFNDDWRIADTYLAAIGQHQYAVTPLQMTRAIAGIATNGTLVTPTLSLQNSGESQSVDMPIEEAHFKVVREGMEYSVTNGTAAGLYLDGVTLAAKTGTAEVDSTKTHIHSWLVGYFPRERPRYAFTILLENGPWGEEVGAVSVAEKIFTWLKEERPEYLDAGR